MRPVYASMTIALWAMGGIGSVAAQAGWPSDPGANFAVADRTSEQAVPKVARTSDGGCYIGWYDHASGNYDVCLQRLDAFGKELWPHNGIYVSSHVQDTWVTDWDLAVDSDGNAIVTFVDLRAGGDWDVYGYRIGPDGSFLWGPDGVAVTDNDEFEAEPRVVQIGDGGFVFVWSSDSGVGVQKLSAGGALEFGFYITGDGSELPSHPDVISADDGNFIVAWMRDSSYIGAHDIRARKYAADGTAMWPALVSVYDGGWVPPWYKFILQTNGAGGAIVGWHRSENNLYSNFVQHLASDGSEVFPHNGVEGSILANRHHLDPTVSYNQATGETFMFWAEENSAQTMWGIYGQKISASGERLWGDTGVQFLPVDGIYDSPPRSTLAGDGAMVFWFDEPTGSVVEDRVVGMRVNADGATVWPELPTVFSSLLSSKDDLCVCPIGSQEAAVLVWSDDRNDERDIYAQNANSNGSLGVPGDLDDDGCVGQPDLGILLGDWGCAGGGCAGDCDGDGDTDQADLGVLLANWGGGC